MKTYIGKYEINDDGAKLKKEAIVFGNNPRDAEVELFHRLENKNIDYKIISIEKM